MVEGLVEVGRDRGGAGEVVVVEVVLVEVVLVDVVDVVEVVLVEVVEVDVVRRGRGRGVGGGRATVIQRGTATRWADDGGRRVGGQRRIDGRRLGPHARPRPGTALR